MDFTLFYKRSLWKKKCWSQAPAASETCTTVFALLLFSPSVVSDSGAPGFSAHGILQARILEWVAFSFSRGSSWPRDWTQVSCFAGREILYLSATTEVPTCHWSCPNFGFWVRAVLSTCGQGVKSRMEGLLDDLLGLLQLWNLLCLYMTLFNLSGHMLNLDDTLYVCVLALIAHMLKLGWYSICVCLCLSPARDETLQQVQKYFPDTPVTKKRATWS